MNKKAKSYILITGNKDHPNTPFVKYVLYEIYGKDKLKYINGEVFEHKSCSLIGVKKNKLHNKEFILNAFDGGSYNFKTLNEDEIENEVMLVVL